LFSGLKSVPAALFRDATQLRKVDLRSNKIESLPEELFSAAKNLNELILKDNLITEIKMHLNR
jgi:Leucine-rich repeat (LRR) protein